MGRLRAPSQLPLMTTRAHHQAPARPGARLRSPRPALRLILALGLTWPSLGCSSEEARLLEAAKREQALGETDAAITLVDELTARFPSSAEATLARPLAEAWLLEAADADKNPHGKEARLKAALEYNPKSGDAKLRLCQLQLARGELEAAARCLGPELDGMTPVPKLKQELDAALAQAREAKGTEERQRLAASPREEDQIALTLRYPGSPEAKAVLAQRKLRESLCAERPRYTRAAHVELLRQEKTLPVEFKQAASQADLDERVAALEALGRDAARRASDLKSLSAEVSEHALRPNEASAQAPLAQALLLISGSLASLAEGLRRDPIENLEAYAAGAQGMVSRWLSATPREAKRVSALLERSEAACLKSTEAAPEAPLSAPSANP